MSTVAGVMRGCGYARLDNDRRKVHVRHSRIDWQMVVAGGRYLATHSVRLSSMQLYCFIKRRSPCCEKSLKKVHKHVVCADTLDINIQCTCIWKFSPSDTLGGLAPAHPCTWCTCVHVHIHVHVCSVQSMASIQQWAYTCTCTYNQHY